MTGATGPQGIQGETGPQGLNGATGPVGPTGPTVWEEEGDGIRYTDGPVTTSALTIADLAEHADGFSARLAGLLEGALYRSGPVVQVVTSNVSPVATIESPADSAEVYRFGVELIGRGDDPEEGRLGGSSLTWRSDRDGVLGCCDTLVVDSLSFGNHQIILAAEDSEGLGDSLAVNILAIDGIDLPCDGTAAKPCLDCAEILAENPGKGNGAYWIDPDGVGGLPHFEVYCDMLTDGGGWTVLMKGDRLDEVYTEAAAGRPTSGDHKLSDDQINAVLNVASDVYNIRFDCGGYVAYGDIKSGWISTAKITTCNGSRYGTKCVPSGSNNYAGVEIHLNEPIGGYDPGLLVSMLHQGVYGGGHGPCRIHDLGDFALYYLSR